MDIYLVRHGEAAASWAQAPDPGLSELGREQARAAARLLRPRLATRAVELISSPLARALETAAPLAAELGLAVRVNEAFREIRAPVPLAERQAAGEGRGGCGDAVSGAERGRPSAQSAWRISQLFRSHSEPWMQKRCSWVRMKICPAEKASDAPVRSPIAFLAST